MTFLWLLSMAFASMYRNLLRTLLTMLGIVIGVAAVIAMMEVGGGAAKQIEESISAMGSNILMVQSAAVRTGGVSSGSGGGITLTAADGEAIVAECPSVRAATPMLTRRGIQIVAGSLNWTPFSVYSGNEDYFTVRDWGEPAAGRYFTKREVDAGLCVCVIGTTIRDELFGESSPIGAEIRLNSVIFQVVGVLPPKGANMMGMDQDDVVVIPWTTMRNRLSRGGASALGGAGGSSSASSSTSDFYPASSGATYTSRDARQAENYPLPVRFDNIDTITVSVIDAEKISSAIVEIEECLRARHRCAPDGSADDFSIRDMSEMLETMTSTSTLMTSLLLIVAMISLVVGGVGIMNIMLVSVTERTREIGLRMAVGARPRRIMAQFLVESAVICLIGGLIGIACGRLTSWLISTLLAWPVAISPGAIFLSVAVSALIGIIFGFYPAWRASRLNPIDALRHE